MSYIARFLIPYKTLDFLRSYFEAIRLIETRRQGNALSESELELLQLITGRIRIAHLAVTIVSCKFALHWLFPSATRTNATLLVDLIGMSGMHRHTQLGLMGFILMLHLLYGGHMFFYYHPYFLTYFYNAIVLNKIGNIFLPPYRVNGRDILQQLHKHLFYSLNLIMIFTFCIRTYGTGLCDWLVSTSC